MRAKRVSIDEQYRLIMECRQSGLSDYQWCLEHNIKPGTFYNWVKRLRQKGGYEIPQANGKDTYQPVPTQEVVRVEIPRADQSLQNQQEVFSEEPLTEMHHPCQPTMELSVSGVRILVSNEIDFQLLSQTLRYLKGSLC